MEYKYIMIRYGEIGTKGKNKKQFISCLYTNIKNALKQIKNVKVYNKYDRLYVALNGTDMDEVFRYLDMISGIASYSPVYFVETDVEKIKEAVKEIALENEFKIEFDIENLDIPIPPIELQNQFAEFVKLIDKQKFEIQKSLGEIQKLQESLMNKYFGG